MGWWHFNPSKRAVMGGKNVVAGPLGVRLVLADGREQVVDHRLRYVGIDKEGVHLFVVTLYRDEYRNVEAGVSVLKCQVLPPRTQLGVDIVERENRQEVNAS